MNATTIRAETYRPDPTTLLTGGFALTAALLGALSLRYGVEQTRIVGTVGMLIAGVYAVTSSQVPWLEGRWVRAAGIGAVLVGLVAVFLALSAGAAAAQGETLVADAAAFFFAWTVAPLAGYVLVVRCANDPRWVRR